MMAAMTAMMCVACSSSDDDSDDPVAEDQKAAVETKEFDLTLGSEVLDVMDVTVTYSEVASYTKQGDTLVCVVKDGTTKTITPTKNSSGSYEYKFVADGKFYVFGAEVKAKTLTSFERCTMSGKFVYTQYILGTTIGSISNIGFDCESYTNAKAGGYTGTLAEWVEFCAVKPMRTELESDLKRVPVKTSSSK